MVTKAAENGAARPKRSLLIGQEAKLTQRDRASTLSVEIV